MNTTTTPSFDEYCQMSGRDPSDPDTRWAYEAVQRARAVSAAAPAKRRSTNRRSAMDRFWDESRRMRETS